MSARIIAEKILGGIMCFLYGLFFLLFFNQSSGPSPLTKNESIIFFISFMLALASMVLYLIGYLSDENSDIAIALKWSGISIGYLLPIIIFFIYKFSKIPKYKSEFNSDIKKWERKLNPEWCQKEVEKAQEKAASGEYGDNQKITICDTVYDFKPNDKWCEKQLELAQQNAARGVYYDNQKISICGTEYEFKRN